MRPHSTYGSTDEESGDYQGQSSNGCTDGCKRKKYLLMRDGSDVGLPQAKNDRLHIRSHCKSLCIREAAFDWPSTS
jgi:hypothetical protein